MKPGLALALIALAASPAPAESLPLTVGGSAAKIAWTHIVASPANDWINDLVPMANGNLMAVGFVNRQDTTPPSDWAAVAAELRPDGKLVAERRYGEGGGMDAFWSMLEGSGGRRMFAGFTTRIGPGGINGFALLTTADGAVVRETGHGREGYDRFTDVTQAADGFVFVGHSQPEGEDRRRPYLVKLDRDGRLVWERIFEAPESWGALYVEPSGDGGYVIAGGMSEANDDANMFVLKTDGQGRELWRARAGTPGWDEINHGIVVRPDRSIVLVGYGHRRGEESNDLVSATLSPDGEVRFIETFGGAGDDRAILPRLDSAGRVWIVGQTASAGAGGTDLLLARLDAAGRFEPSALTIGTPADDHGTALLPLSDGAIVLAGYSRGLGRGGEDAFVLRLAPVALGDPHPAFRAELIQP